MTSFGHWISISLAAVALAGGACGKGNHASPANPDPLIVPENAMTMTMTSTSFAAQGEIPSKHTCEGDDVSPALAWTDVPAEAKSLVLIVDDPDAPDPKAPKMTWVHWVLYDLPPTLTGLPEHVATSELPAGTRQGLNDWTAVGYRGPCPPIGRHRYFHKLYALDTVLGGLGKANKAKVEEAMKGHVLAAAELVGTYQKKQGK